jgi:hypothetical protein
VARLAPPLRLGPPRRRSGGAASSDSGGVTATGSFRPVGSARDGRHLRCLPTIMLVVVAAALIAPGIASARIAAHGSFKRDILKDAYRGFSLPPNRCIDVWTWRFSPFWASEYWAGEHHRGCGGYASLSTNILHEEGDTWRFVAQERNWSCSTLKRPRKVPSNIFYDLLGCRQVAAHQPGLHFTRCPGRIVEKHDRYFAADKIEARHITCATAYGLIRNFPATLPPGSLYRGYTCTFKYVPPNGSRAVCTSGRKAFRFSGGGA